MKLLITFSFSLFSLSWLCVLFLRNYKFKVIYTILGPYLLFSSLVQFGIFSDRSQDLRIEIENLYGSEISSLSKIRVLTNEIINDETQSKIIKVSVFNA